MKKIYFKLLGLVVLLLMGMTSFAQTHTATITVAGSSFCSEVSWDIVDNATGTNLLTGVAGCTTETVTLNDGGSYDIVGYDSFGDGWDDGSATVEAVPCGVDVIPVASGLLASFNSGSGPASESFTAWTPAVSPVICGCLDPTASNYNANAHYEDGSCTYSCTTPSNLSASNVTGTTADLSWDAVAGVGGYNWEVVPAGNGQGVGVVSSGSVATNMASASGLTDLTDYEFYVQSACAGSVSFWEGPFAFTTCDGNAAEFNLEDSFGDGWNGNGYVITDLNTSMVVASGTLATGSAQTDNLCLPDGCYEIAVGEAPANEGSFDNEVSWSLVIGGVTISSGGAPETTAPFTIGAGVCAFCADVSDLAAANFTATTADLSWTSNNADMTDHTWDVEVLAQGGTPATGAEVFGATALTTTSVTATGLAVETFYDMYVLEHCDGADGDAEWVGPFTFAIPPANDDCAGAIDIDACGGTIMGNTDFATDDAGLTSCTTTITAPGLWYKLTNVGTGDYKVSLCGSAFDTKLHVFSGDCAALTCVAGNDDNFAACGSGNNSELDFSATAGTDYFVLVSGFGSNTGEFTLTTSDVGAPIMACQDISVSLSATGSTAITAMQIDNGSADNCSATVTLGLDVTDFTCANLGANTVTLTGTDDDGNSATCTATVTVVDDMAPSVSATGFTALLGCGGTPTTVTMVDLGVTATDNCTASPTISLSKSEFTSADIGNNTVTVSASDDSGNTGMMDVTVTVIDPSTIFVNDDAAGDNNGTSWANAYNKLEDALANTGACPEINVWVAAGTYVPGTMRTSTFDVPANVKLIGGLAGTEGIGFDISSRDAGYVATNLTILSGDVDGNDAASPVVDPQTEIMGDNAYTVVTLQNGVLDFSGFTVTAGKADAAGNTAPLGWKSGAGVLNMGSPEMYELMINGNYAKTGAGIYNNGEGTGNSASPMMNNITFMANYSEFDGAGLYNDGRAGGDASPMVTNGVFMGNKSGSASAGAYNNGRIGGTSAPTYMMCTFAGNEAPNGGTAMVNDEADVTLAMVNMYDNNDGAGNQASPIVDFNSTVTISDSNVEGYYQNQMNQDPAFMVAPAPNTAVTTWDLSLKSSSPLIGMGNNTDVPAWITKDRAGNARIQEGTIDIGAYETAFAALPVELVSFTGTAREAKSVLTWATAAEYNSAYFNVEHSLDGENFTSLGKVAAAGESTTEIAYDFTHDLPAAGINYYRLQMMDNDNTFEYSNVVALTFEKGAIAIFPNPADDHIVISVGNEVTFERDLEISIYNNVGQLVQSMQTAETNKQIDVTSLPAGTYTVRIKADNQLFNEQIIITH